MFNYSLTYQTSSINMKQFKKLRLGYKRCGARLEHWGVKNPYAISYKCDIVQHREGKRHGIDVRTYFQLKSMSWHLTHGV